VVSSGAAAKQPLAPSTADNSFKTPAAPKAAARVGGGEAAAAAAAGGKAAVADSPSLTIKVLDPVSTGGKGAARAAAGAAAGRAMGPPAGKTPAAFKTPAPPPAVSEQVCM
jgi:hypothetical protein